MASEIAVLGQLGTADEKVPDEGSILDKTSGDRTVYTTQQESTLPNTGEVQGADCIRFIGLLCLIIILIFKTFEKFKPAA